MFGKQSVIGSELAVWGAASLQIIIFWRIFHYFKNGWSKRGIKYKDIRHLWPLYNVWSVLFDKTIYFLYCHMYFVS